MGDARMSSGSEFEIFWETSMNKLVHQDTAIMI